MPPKAARRQSPETKKEPAVEQEADDDLTRLPDSSSEEEYDAGDIIPTDFRRGPEKPEEEKPKELSRKNGKSTHNKKNGNAFSATIGMRPTRKNAVLRSSNSATNSTSSPKRKSQEDATELGAGMKDELGFVKSAGVKRAKTYGKSGQAGYGKATKPKPKVPKSLCLGMSLVKK